MINVVSRTYYSSLYTSYLDYVVVRRWLLHLFQQGHSSEPLYMYIYNDLLFHENCSYISIWHQNWLIFVWTFVCCKLTYIYSPLFVRTDLPPFQALRTEHNDYNCLATNCLFYCGVLLHVHTPASELHIKWSWIGIYPRAVRVVLRFPLS